MFFNLIHGPVLKALLVFAGFISYNCVREMRGADVFSLTCSVMFSPASPRNYLKSLDGKMVLLE